MSIVDIHPGFGRAGIVPARIALMKACEEAAGKVFGPTDKIYIIEDRDCPCLRVEFDEHTTLYITFWPHGPNYGFEPSWHLTTSQGGSLMVPELPRRPLRWNSEAEHILHAIQRIIADVKLETVE